MPEPASTSVVTYFSITKIWSIIAGVSGSIVPIIMLAEKHKITVTKALLKAIVGTSFSVFVGPFLAEKFGFSSIESIVALSWALGVLGVSIVRTIVVWLERRGVETVDKAINKAIDTINIKK